MFILEDILWKRIPWSYKFEKWYILYTLYPNSKRIVKALRNPTKEICYM